MFEGIKAKAYIPQLFEIADDLYADIIDVNRIPMASVFDTQDAVISLAWLLCEFFRKDKKIGVEIAKQAIIQTGRFDKTIRGGVEQLSTSVQSGYIKYRKILNDATEKLGSKTDNVLEVYRMLRESLSKTMAEIIGDIYGYEGDSIEVCGEAFDRIFTLVSK